MRLMTIQIELSTNLIPLSSQYGYFLTNNTGTLERNGTTLGIGGQRKVFISLGFVG
jgi:hypothetical protein